MHCVLKPYLLAFKQSTSHFGTFYTARKISIFVDVVRSHLGHVRKTNKPKLLYMFDFLLVICIFDILNYPLTNWVKKGKKKANEGLKKALKAK